MKHSIIIPVFNQLPYTIACIQSVFDNTKDFELFVVDNGSTDGTAAYLQALVSAHPNVKTATFPQNQGFAPACNAPLQHAQGDFITFLNNDTLVTPHWADHLADAIPLAEKQFDLSPVGLVGPVSNNAAGLQGIQTDPYTPDNLEQAARDHYDANKGTTHLAGLLSGFCLMLTRPCLDDIGGFDENFTIGGWEDNELCLRAHRAGWKSAIDPATFIHHHGQRTLSSLDTPYAPQFRLNQIYFYDKYYDDAPHDLAAIFRVRNDPDGLRNALTSASAFADKLFVLCDRCTDETPTVAKSFAKVEKVIELHGDFNEYRDRSILFHEANASGAHWTISLDADEQMEPTFTHDVAHKLMTPLDPQILGYGFNVFNFFLGRTHYRTDGTFGQLWGVRMWHNLPKQEIRSLGHKGLHCTHGPMLPKLYIKQIRHRLMHFGYDSPAKCEQKYRFYVEKDPHPDPTAVSPTGYKHLISPNLTLNAFQPHNTLALAMIVRNEEINLFALLSRYHHLFDEIIIVDTGSKDRTKTVAATFGAQIFDFKFRDNFAAARNYAKSQCTAAWILSLDPDEEIDDDDTPQLFKMIEDPVDAYLFRVINFQKDHTVVYSDNVRLFRNIPEIQWAHRCHENISDAATKHALTVTPAPFDIKHMGFLKDHPTRQAKIKSYGRMLRKQIREEPDRALGYFHYAFHLFEQGKETTALHHLQKALQLEPDFFLAHKELGLRYLTKAQHHLQRCTDTIPPNHYFADWIHAITQDTTNILNAPVETYHEPIRRSRT